MSILRIGFIQANQKADVQWFKPLAFGYLKAYLDKNLENPVIFEFIENLADAERYDIMAISSTSQDYSEAIKIASEIKRINNKIITILGGHHVTYLSSTLAPCFDLGVLGEGEETFLELVKYLQENAFDSGVLGEGEETYLSPAKYLRATALDPDNFGLKSIKGLAIRKGYKIVLTEPRDLINPLDKIPHPYRQENDTQYLFTSRGCPYKCVFCSSSVFWKKTRSFSAEHVVEEIEQILRLFPDTEHIPIEDDIFVLDIKRLKKIISLMEERKLNKRVAFSFAVRANLVTDQLCELLKKFNVRTVCFGAESASDRILKILMKGTTSAINQNALDTLHRHGITTICSFIVGIPTETEEEVISTYEFLTKNIFEGKLGSFSAVNILAPMPGTQIWKQAVESGTINIKNFKWSRLAGFSSYRSSNINNFAEWVDHRIKNNSVYLNEETLPQRRLYGIMGEYEDKIKSFEINVGGSRPIDPEIRRESLLAHQYCIGKGLEIGGASHNPFGLNTLNVDINNDTTIVDIIANGDFIPLPDGSQDFIVSSHVFEHFSNPIKALIEWDRLIKTNGIIFMIVPHKKRTFDSGRERTTLSHLIEDYKNDETEIMTDFNGHNHVWITTDIVDLVNYMIKEMNMQWELVEIQDVDDKVGNGFTIVIKKWASIAVRQYVCPKPTLTFGFGALINDIVRCNMVLRQSEIDGNLNFVKEPTSAVHGLNKLLNLIENSGMDVAILVHQDMYFRQGWISMARMQLEQLSDDWIVAGIIGKDKNGCICGRLHDMRMPLLFDSKHVFPVEASCFDECCIMVNMRSGFRFDEGLTGFDLYGSMAALQAKEMGGTAWIIDAFAEHYCLRKFPWHPGEDFFKGLDWLKQRFPDAERIDSTAFGGDGKIFNPEIITCDEEEEKWQQSVDV